MDSIKNILLGTFVMVMLLMQGLVMAAPTDVKTTSSNVTVVTYISISLSQEMASVVEFGSMAPGSTDQEAQYCESYNCNITVSADTNVNIDIVLKADQNMTRQGGNETIPASAYTWNSSSSGNPWYPPSLNGYAIKTNGYDFTNKLGDDLSANAMITWTAWIDIPSNQSEGIYGNTLYFCANTYGSMDCS